MTFTHGAGVAFPAPGAMTYSRPSRENPPIPLKRISPSSGAEHLRSEPCGRWARVGTSRGIRTSAGTRRLIWSARRSAAVDDDRARDRLEEKTVLGRNLLRMPHEDAARPVDEVRFDAGSDQSEDLLLKPLPIDVVIFVPDDQVDRKPLQAPIRVRLDQLPYQVDVAGGGNLQQHDRQVAGDRVAPETGLPATVPDQNARGGTQRCIGIDHRAGKAAVELRIGFGGVELLQHHLTVRPCQFEHAIDQTAILVLVDETQYVVARLAGARDHVDRRRSTGVDGHPVADRRYRIQYRAAGVRQRARIGHRARCSDRTAPTDEAHAVRLERDLARRRAPCTVIR